MKKITKQNTPKDDKPFYHLYTAYEFETNSKHENKPLSLAVLFDTKELVKYTQKWRAHERKYNSMLCVYRVCFYKYTSPKITHVISL